MAGDRDGNRVIDGVRRGAAAAVRPLQPRRPRTSRPNTARPSPQHQPVLRICHFRVLGFFATVTQTGAAVQVELLGHAPGAPTGTVSGTVSGQTVNFPSFSLSEAMGRGAALVASGTANVATNGLSITGTLSGTFQTPSGLSCNAANHQIQMVKLCSQPTATGTALLPCQQ